MNQAVRIEYGTSIRVPPWDTLMPADMSKAFKLCLLWLFLLQVLLGCQGFQWISKYIGHILFFCGADDMFQVLKCICEIRDLNPSMVGAWSWRFTILWWNGGFWFLSWLTTNINHQLTIEEPPTTSYDPDLGVSKWSKRQPRNLRHFISYSVLFCPQTRKPWGSTWIMEKQQQNRNDYAVHGSKIWFLATWFIYHINWSTTLNRFGPKKSQDLAASTSRMMIALSKSCYVKLQDGRTWRWGMGIDMCLHEEKSEWDRSRLLVTKVFDYYYKHIKQLTQK